MNVAKSLCTVKLTLIVLGTSYVKGTIDGIGMADMLDN